MGRRGARASQVGRAGLAVAGLVALGMAVRGLPAWALRAGERAPEFSLPGVDGKQVKLSSFAGKVVLVDFWASWCEPCKRELPILSQLAGKLRSSGIEIVAVNIDKNRDKADAFLRSRKIVGVTVVFNSDLSVADRYQPPTMPSSFGIDRQGRVRFVHAGFSPGDEKKLEAELLKLVK